MTAFPDPGGDGVTGILAAADAAARLTAPGAELFAGYRQRYMFGLRDTEVLDAADDALDADDWDRDLWWQR